MPSPWGLTLKNLFLPIFCRECGCSLLTEENGFFCPGCWSVPQRIERPFCSVCGKPHKDRVGFGPVENFPCAECRTAPAKPYSRLFAACDYDGAIAEAIKLLKFYDRPRLAVSLGEELWRFAEREMTLDAYDALVPVPLHHVRRRARGYNQSELLADCIAPAFPSARLDRSLRRIRPTRTQSSLTTRAQRRANVRGAFAVDSSAHFNGETVLLVDDVVTTGGTVAECARALRRAGASEIHVFAVATPIVAPDWNVPSTDADLRPRRVGMRLGI